MYLRLSPYREVLQGVLTSLQVNEGIIKITGKSGAGKTALCSQLFNELESSGQPAVFFLKPPASAVALQNDILDNLQLDSAGNFTRTLTAFLLARTTEQKPLVLIFDDAQQLDPQTFSAIRMLCNIQDQSRALIRVILCGNDELDEKLGGPALRAITQFVNQSFALPFLTQEQVIDFCQGYWLQTNADMKPLSERSLHKLFQETRGQPGILQARLNQGTTGAEKNVRYSDAGNRPAPVKPYRYAGRRPDWIPGFFIIATLLVLGGGGAYFVLQAPTTATPVNGVTSPPREPQVQAATPVQPAPLPPVVAAAAPDAAGTGTGVTEPATDAEIPPVLAVESEPSPEAEIPVTPEVAVAADATAAEQPAEAALPPVAEFITAWTGSWQRKDVEAYLAHYHPDFTPAQGSQEAWREQRRRVIGNAADIVISADTPEASIEALDGTHTVRFWLNYRAANYADRTLKELLLVPVDGAWRIRTETNLRTEPQ